MSKIVNKWWFTTYSGDTVGIIKVNDEITNENKFYMGIASGINEDFDAEIIKSSGAKFVPELIK